MQRKTCKHIYNFISFLNCCSKLSSRSIFARWHGILRVVLCTARNINIYGSYMCNEVLNSSRAKATLSISSFCNTNQSQSSVSGFPSLSAYKLLITFMCSTAMSKKTYTYIFYFVIKLIKVNIVVLEKE